MSGQALVAELRAFVAQWRKDTQKSDMIYGLMHTEDGKLVEDVISATKLERAADTIEAQAKEIAMLRETFSARSYKRMLDARDEQFARAERAELKSAELAAVIVKARERLDDKYFTDNLKVDYVEAVLDVEDILGTVPEDLLSAYTTRIREEALTGIEFGGKV